MQSDPQASSTITGQHCGCIELMSSWLWISALLLLLRRAISSRDEDGRQSVRQRYWRSRDQLFTDESLPIRGNLDRGVVGSVKWYKRHICSYFKGRHELYSL